VILDDICKCSENEGLTNLNEELQAQKFAMCMVEARGRYKESFVKIYGEGTSEDDFAWAEKVGTDLATECPFLMRLAVKTNETDSTKAKPEAVSAGKEEVLNALCGCFDREAPKAGAAEAKVNGCIGEVYGGHAVAFKKEYGVFGSDEGLNREIGRQIGTDLAPRCPSFMQVVTTMLDEQKKGKK
jgi:hypothetical protein